MPASLDVIVEYVGTVVGRVIGVLLCLRSWDMGGLTIVCKDWADESGIYRSCLRASASWRVNGTSRQCWTK